MKIQFKFRVALLFSSVVLRLAMEDKEKFLTKIAERFQSSGNFPSSFYHKHLPTRIAQQKSEARRLINAGHLLQGIQTVEKQGQDAARSDKKLAKTALEHLGQLMATPMPARQNSGKNTEHRVLHFLTNSIPYTQSGYTLRSQKVLEAQQISGIEVAAVTRLAYPIVIGKVPDSSSQSIEGVKYYRMLPRVYPSRRVDRDEMTVDMLVELARNFGATALQTTTNYENGLLVSRAAARLNIPWVYEVRGELESTWLSKQPENVREEAKESEYYRMARNQETASAKSAAAVVVLSEITKDQLVRRGVIPDKIHVVPNAIDDKFIGAEFDKERIRLELELPNGPLVGTVTSVVDYEGLDTLIRSLQHLPEPVKAVIVGDGTARPELEVLTRHLGLESRVYFIGKKPQEDIWKWYAALDVFVVPRKDFLVCRVVTPIKTLMAQALGIPVVASDLPALREVTGNLAEYIAPENPNALAEAIEFQLGNPGENREIKYWISSRTWKTNGEHYSEIYENMMAD